MWCLYLRFIQQIYQGCNSDLAVSRHPAELWRPCAGSLVTQCAVWRMSHSSSAEDGMLDMCCIALLAALLHSNTVNVQQELGRMGSHRRHSSPTTQEMPGDDDLWTSSSLTVRGCACFKSNVRKAQHIESNSIMDSSRIAGSFLMKRGFLLWNGLIRWLSLS